MSKKIRTKKPKPFSEICDEIVAEINGKIHRPREYGIDREQVIAVYNCDFVTLDESHPIHSRIKGALIERGLTPSKKE